MNTLIRYIIARYYLRQYAKKDTVKHRAIMKVSGTGTYYVLIKTRGRQGWRDRVRVANRPAGHPGPRMCACGWIDSQNARHTIQHSTRRRSVGVSHGVDLCRNSEKIKNKIIFIYCSQT